MIPQEVSNAVIEFLSLEGENHQFVSASKVSGGCINACFRFETDKQVFFLKHNQTDAFPGMFEAEARGLTLLSQNVGLKVPEVLTEGTAGDQSFLLLEWLDECPGSEAFERSLGPGLAQQHKISNPSFGLDHENYIGSLRQTNTATDDWVDFFYLRRLSPMRQMAFDQKLLDRADLQAFERMAKALPEIIPNEKPALLHGDLWSGNKMPVGNGMAAVFDPAVYFGHREVDLAMTKLFGGFGAAFYDAYSESFPLEPGWELRVAIHNLYPLLVHLILFGRSYYSDIASTLKRF